MQDLHPHWEDLKSNSRDQLIQMLRELEVPYFQSATNNELRLIIQNRITKNDPELDEKVKKIYVETRYKRRSYFKSYLIRFVLVFAVCFLFIHYVNKVNISKPYCDGMKYKKNCRPCPEGAKCEKGKAKCPSKQFPTIIGCKDKKDKLSMRHLMRSIQYIQHRDGDCIDKKEPLSIEAFNLLFPEVNVSNFDDPRLGIAKINGTLTAITPKPLLSCRILNGVEKYSRIIGPILLLGCIGIAKLVETVIRRKQDATATDLARQAHKILATSGKEVYMYDMKVQLRAKYSKIDLIWRRVVKKIELDSHVIVGVKGARHQVYWKWVASIKN